MLSEGHGWFRLTLRRSTWHNITRQWLFLLFSSKEQLNTWKQVYIWKIINILLLPCTRSSFKLPSYWLHTHACAHQLQDCLWAFATTSQHKDCHFPPRKNPTGCSLDFDLYTGENYQISLAEPCRTASGNSFYSVLTVHTCSLSLQTVVGMAQAS